MMQLCTSIFIRCICGQRLCIDLSILSANILTTLRSHSDVIFSYLFWYSLFNVDVNYNLYI
jgi:hypothetical protein